MSSLVRTLTPVKKSKLNSFDAADFGLHEIEMFFMRLGFALLIFLTIKWEMGSLTSVKPEDAVGLGKLVDLTFLAHMKGVIFWQILTIIGLIAYVLGTLPAVGLLPALFFAIGTGTLDASHGADNHSTQLCSMILLGQFLVYAFPKMSREKLRATSWLMPDTVIDRRAIYVSMVIFAACYVVSAWVKLENSHWLWFHKVVPGLALELQKTNWSEYYDTLQPVPPILASMVGLMNEHPTLARLFFGCGLFLELFAFLTLLGRRWAFFYGLALIVMHLTISHLMQLDFWYHIWAAVIFLLNLPGLRWTSGSSVGMELPTLRR